MKKLIQIISILIVLSGCTSVKETPLDKAKFLFKNGKYVEARDECEKILVRDPYNKDAMELLKKIYPPLIEKGKERREADQNKMGGELWKFKEEAVGNSVPSSPKP